MTITDQEQASRTPGDKNHYLTDSVVVSNAAASAKLVNIVVTMTWKDEGPGVETTSEYVPAPLSDGDCVPAGENALSCVTTKSLAPGGTLDYGPLIFRTATDEAATGFTLTVKATAKEQDKPSKGGAPPNDAVATLPNTTPYEGSPEFDVSLGGDGLAATLVTAQTGGGTQFSELPVPAGAPRGFYEMRERNYVEDGGTATCPSVAVEADYACFGQQVTTTTVTGFAPVNLLMTFEGQLQGASESKIAVVHERDGGATVLITETCPSATPSLAEITELNGCLSLVEVTHLGGSLVRVEISAWDISNGGWGGVG